MQLLRWLCLISIFFYMLQEDLHYPRSKLQNAIWASVNMFVEPILNCWPLNMLRERALKNLMDHIHYEDESTKYIGICPINKVICKMRASCNLPQTKNRNFAEKQKFASLNFTLSVKFVPQLRIDQSSSLTSTFGQNHLYPDVPPHFIA